MQSHDLVKLDAIIWVFPKIGVSQNGWLIMENPIKIDDLGGKHPYFWVDTHIDSTKSHPEGLSRLVP